MTAPAPTPTNVNSDLERLQKEAAAMALDSEDTTDDEDLSSITTDRDEDDEDDDDREDAGVDIVNPGNGTREAVRAPDPPPPRARARAPRQRRIHPNAAAAPPPTPTKMSKMLPDAEQVRVYKIHLGRHAYITTWQYRDVAAAQGDIERMVQENLVPEHGPGEYELVHLSQTGQELKRIPVSIAGSLKPASQTVVVDKGRDTMPYLADMNKLVEDRATRLEQRVADLQEKLLEQAQQQPPSLLEQIAELTEAQKALGKDDVTKLLPFLQQKQQATVDPTLLATLAELRAEIRDIRKSTAFPPLPPLPPPPEPPPPVDLVGLMQATLAAAKSPISITEIAALMRPPGNSEIAALKEELRSLKDKQVVDMIRDFKDEMRAFREQMVNGGKRGGLAETMEEMKAFHAFTQSISPSRKDETFWGFMDGLVKRLPETMTSINSLVDRVREDEAKRLPAAGQSTASTTTPTTEAKKEPPALPSELPGHVAEIEKAPDDAGRIGATLKALYSLGKHPQWTAHLKAMIGKAKAGQKEEKDGPLEFIKTFLDAMVKRGHLTEPKVEQTVNAFRVNWEQVLVALTAAGA